VKLSSSEGNWEMNSFFRIGFVGKHFSNQHDKIRCINMD
jgi:hypothetical protein